MRIFLEKIASQQALLVQCGMKESALRQGAEGEELHVLSLGAEGPVVAIPELQCGVKWHAVESNVIGHARVAITNPMRHEQLVVRIGKQSNVIRIFYERKHGRQ